MKSIYFLFICLLHFSLKFSNANWQRKCAILENVFATIDFGSKTDPKRAFGQLREYQKTGPLVNSEYYPGWINRWEMPYEHVDSKVFCDNLDVMLAMNVSVNIYPVCGGTLFGFMAGATHAEGNDFKPVVTSYEFDGPLTEAGDPKEKYFAIRNVIKKYMKLPDIPLPTASQKMQLPPILMKPIASLFDEHMLSNPIPSDYPLRFEELRLRHGFVLYSTNISDNELKNHSETHNLNIDRLADRAQVFVDKKYIGTLSRTHRKYNLSLKVEKNSRLDILVENQGRFAFLDIQELKGILTNVTLGDVILKKWNHYLFYKNWGKSIELIEKESTNTKTEISKGIPTIFSGIFQLPNDSSLPHDSFLKLEGWGKGVAFLNGFNLGRYWPLAGPQHTLYSPSNLFKPYPQENRLTVFELEKNPCDKENECLLQFVKEHVLNGTVSQDI